VFDWKAAEIDFDLDNYGFDFGVGSGIDSVVWVSLRSCEPTVGLSLGGLSVGLSVGLGGLSVGLDGGLSVGLSLGYKFERERRSLTSFLEKIKNGFGNFK
jgi:hypothetical protein